MVVGFHLIVDFHTVSTSILMTVRPMRKILEEGVRRGNLTKISSSYHQFQPYGVSGIILLAESHLSVHTFPESGLVTMDVYSCGEDAEKRVKNTVNYILGEMGGVVSLWKEVERG